MKNTYWSVSVGGRVVKDGFVAAETDRDAMAVVSVSPEVAAVLKPGKWATLKVGALVASVDGPQDAGRVKDTMGWGEKEEQQAVGSGGGHLFAEPKPVGVADYRGYGRQMIEKAKHTLRGMSGNRGAAYTDDEAVDLLEATRIHNPSGNRISVRVVDVTRNAMRQRFRIANGAHISDDEVAEYLLHGTPPRAAHVTVGGGSTVPGTGPIQVHDTDKFFRAARNICNRNIPANFAPYEIVETERNFRGGVVRFKLKSLSGRGLMDWFHEVNVLEQVLYKEMQRA